MFRLKADSARAVETFIDRCAESGVVWILDDNDYVAGCPSTDGGTDVFPVFSDRAYAARGAKCWGGIYPPESMPLEVFMQKLLPAYSENGQLVGPNWDGNMAGAEVDPRELLDRLEAALRTKSRAE